MYKTTIDDLTQQIKKQKQTIAQSKSKVDFHETRIKELEQNLVDATNEEAKNVAMEALKAEALAGKNKEIVALDERIRQETEALRKLESLESVLAERYKLNSQSADALKNIQTAVLSISTELSAFQLAKEQSSENLSSEQLALWHKFQTDYANGINAIDRIVADFKRSAEDLI